MITPLYLLERLQRVPDIHKGHCGRVLVLAGSAGYVGAACLCARGALASGAGLVTLGVPRSLLPVVGAKLTACMTHPFREVPGGAFALGALPEIAEAARRASVVAVGPGLGRHRSTRKLVHAIVQRIDRPLVLDADALNALEGHVRLLATTRHRPILTPHPGEMARLVGLSIHQVQADRQRAACALARAYGLIVALKGYHTIVAERQDLYKNETGNPGLATGGTGDVLTGMIAGLVAQRLGPYEAACLGVYLHGLAGDLAAAKLGEHALTAVDILDHIGGAFLAAATNANR